MSYKSPTLPGIALGIVVAILVAHWQQGDIALETSDSRSPMSDRQKAPPATGILGESPAYAAMRPENDSGAELLARAIDNLKRQHSVAAKARQEANLYDQQLNGTGSYTQMAGPEGVALSRFELKLQTADGPANWQQVCDGAALWTYRKNLDGPRLASVDINIVLTAYRKQLGGSRAESAASLSPAIGGLPELLDSLARHMTFKEVFSERLGDVDVWVVKGRWNPATLSDLLRDQRDRIREGKSPDWSKAPRHVPDHVLVYLGKSDLFLASRHEPIGLVIQNDHLSVRRYCQAVDTSRDGIVPPAHGKSSHDGDFCLSLFGKQRCQCWLAENSEHRMVERLPLVPWPKVSRPFEIA